jgi:hypothetical protein
LLAEKHVTEFGLAYAPEEASEHYPGVNQELLRLPDPRASDDHNVALGSR